MTYLMDRLIDFCVRYVDKLPSEFQGVVALPDGLDRVRYIIVA